MAHDLRAGEGARLHQALHGYADGHRELALSTTLKTGDQKRLLALSDVSGPGAQLGRGGYLTGYPLTESGFYALGRTWPAPEMPRPGCVWTHTLLVDFTDLGSLGSLAGLMGMFRRPFGAGSAADYGVPTALVSGAEAQPSAVGAAWVRRVMAGLYGMPQSRVVVSRFGDEVDDTVLALWSQQWPRLRRRFRFCTLAARDRSSEGASFDLQVLPSRDRSVRTRFTGVLDVEVGVSTSGGWLEDAVQDLLQPEGSGLRELFRRLGADVAAGREMFRPFCRLHRLLAAARARPEAVAEAIAVLEDEIGEDQSVSARAMVARAGLKQVESLDEKSFGFLWKSLSLLDEDTLRREAVRLGRVAWRREPGLLEGCLDENSVSWVVDRTLADLDIAELVGGLAVAAQLRGPALAQRPELVGEPAFWAELGSVDGAFQAGKDWDTEGTASALMVSGREDLALRAVQEFGSGVILRALRASWDSMGDTGDTWLQASVGDRGVVGRFLTGEYAIPKPMIYGLARALPPDAVGNEDGEDPWLVADCRAVGAIGDSAGAYMAAYLLSRALSQRSCCPGELAQASFESTHAALENGRLQYEGWRLLESKLARYTTWFEWDRCHRLRASVASLFVDEGLAPGLFVRLCENDQLFALVSSRAAKSKRGRNYLKRVRRFMEEEVGGGFAARVKIIVELLR